MPVQNVPAGEWTNPEAAAETAEIVALLQDAVANRPRGPAMSALANCLAVVVAFTDKPKESAHAELDRMLPILHKAIDQNWDTVQKMRRGKKAFVRPVEHYLIHLI